MINLKLPTAAEVRASAEEYTTPQAADFLVRLSGGHRHDLRVAQVMDDISTGAISPVEIMIDAIGTGGVYGLTGEATLRFGRCGQYGKGRKQAGDGRAWSAALLQALQEWLKEKGVGPLAPWGEDKWGITLYAKGRKEGWEFRLTAELESHQYHEERLLSEWRTTPEDAVALAPYLTTLVRWDALQDSDRATWPTWVAEAWGENPALQMLTREGRRPLFTDLPSEDGGWSRVEDLLLRGLSKEALQELHNPTPVRGVA